MGNIIFVKNLARAIARDKMQQKELQINSKQSFVKASTYPILTSPLKLKCSVVPKKQKNIVNQ